MFETKVPCYSFSFSNIKPPIFRSLSSSAEKPTWIDPSYLVWKNEKSKFFYFGSLLSTLSYRSPDSKIVSLSTCSSLYFGFSFCSAGSCSNERVTISFSYPSFIVWLVKMLKLEKLFWGSQTRSVKNIVTPTPFTLIKGVHDIFSDSLTDFYILWETFWISPLRTDPNKSRQKYRLAALCTEKSKVFYIFLSTDLTPTVNPRQFPEQWTPQKLTPLS